MNGTLTGMPTVDDLIRSITGGDGEDDDSGSITALDALSPDRLDAVDVPATGLPFLVLKSARQKDRGGPSAAALVLKRDTEKRYTLCVAYPADRADRGVAGDGYRDFAQAAALQDAAWNFLRKGGACGLMHEDGTTGAGEVVESYLWPGDDWTMTAADGSTQTIRKGDWMAGIVWSPGAWQAIKAGRLRGVSMQGGAVRRKPTAGELAALRKSAPGARWLTAVENVGWLTVALDDRLEAGTATRADYEALGSALAELGDAYRADPGERAEATIAMAKAAERAVTRAVAKAVQAEAGAAAAAVAKAAAPVMREAVSAGSVAAGRAGYLLRQYASPGRRERAFGELVREFGAQDATRLLAGDVAAEVLGARVAKAAAADGMSRCRTCKGSGRLRHPGTGALSRRCPECLGTGEWTPKTDEEIDMTPEDMTLAEQYTQQARGGDGAALGKLSAVVGPDVAARLTAGVPVSAQEFRRGYLAAARAPQSAAPGQEPGIPQADHVVTAADFRRGPLGAGQSRPAPGSTWPGQGGQADFYRPGPGITAARYGAGGSHLTPGLAASTRTGAQGG